MANRNPAIRVTAMPADANAYGDIFGGWLMSLMDSAAGLVAARRPKGRAVTVAMDGMQFHEPVTVGDEVSGYCEIESIGRTSMKIATEAWRRHRHEEEQQQDDRKRQYSTLRVVDAPAEQRARVG